MLSKRNQISLFFSLILSCAIRVDSFHSLSSTLQASRSITPRPGHVESRIQTSPYLHSSSTSLYVKLQMSQSGGSGDKPEYSRELLLREEAESPFRKVRFFFYFALGAGAMTSLAVSAARVAAALAGVNTDLLQESATNAGVDLIGLVVLAFFYFRDLKAQESRLKRASKGAELARLLVRGSKSLLVGDDEDLAESSSSGGADKAETFTTSLASLRRGRGIEKRVVIAAAGAATINTVLKDATRLQESLELSDLLIVPVVMPSGVAPDISGNIGADQLPGCVAMPVGSNWRNVVEDEAEEAVQQGVDILKDGFCIILKKNGRVGQRTKGIFLDRMVEDVTARSDLGMDIKNI